MMTNQAEKMLTVIQQAKNAWETGDAEAFTSLFSTNGEFVVPGNACVGQDAIRKVTIDYFSSHSDVKIEIKRIVIEGELAAVEWHWQEREIATNQIKDADDAIIIDFRDDRILRWREYIDTETNTKNN